MGGKRHDGNRITREEAWELFIKLHNELALGGATNLTANLAGSYRRGKTECGDLDIVIGKFDDKSRAVFDTWCVNKFGTLGNGRPRRTGLVDGVQVEFYVADEATWGTQLQMWTGSMRHNIKLRGRAKKLGFSLSQYGFKNQETGEVTTCATEEEVYAFLQMGFIPPEER